MPDSFAGSSMAPSSSAAASMAALAAAAASGDASDDSGAPANNGAPPTHGVEGNSPEELAAVGGASSSSSRAAARRVATVGASPAAATRSRGAGAASGGGVVPSCQVERCNADMGVEKRYNRRHKVCDAHRKASVVLLAGLRQRFCQQCSRFHELSHFDDTKRSCRLRLAGHNERRRRNPADAHDQNGGRRGDPAGNHFQIR